MDKVSIPRIDRFHLDDDFNEDDASPFIKTASKHGMMDTDDSQSDPDVTSWKHPQCSPTAIKSVFILFHSNLLDQVLMIQNLLPLRVARLVFMFGM